MVNHALVKMRILVTMSDCPNHITTNTNEGQYNKHTIAATFSPNPTDFYKDVVLYSRKPLQWTPLDFEVEFAVQAACGNCNALMYHEPSQDKDFHLSAGSPGYRYLAVNGNLSDCDARDLDNLNNYDSWSSWLDCNGYCG